MRESVALVKSRWRFVAKRGVRTATFLRLLGVEFREDKSADDNNFMRVNAHILPLIYEQMQDEARAKLHELHPDKGGNAYEFDAFIQCYNTIKKRFLLYLPVIRQEVSTKVVTRVVKNQRKAKQAKARRQRDLEGYRAKRRALYARQKAAGTLFVRKNKPKRSAASLAHNR